MNPIIPRGKVPAGGIMGTVTDVGEMNGKRLWLLAVADFRLCDVADTCTSTHVGHAIRVITIITITTGDILTRTGTTDDLIAKVKIS